MNDNDLSSLTNKRFVIPQDALPTTEAANYLDIQERLKRARSFSMSSQGVTLDKAVRGSTDGEAAQVDAE